MTQWRSSDDDGIQEYHSNGERKTIPDMMREYTQMMNPEFKDIRDYSNIRLTFLIELSEKIDDLIDQIDQLPETLGYLENDFDSIQLQLLNNRLKDEIDDITGTTINPKPHLNGYQP